MIDDAKVHHSSWFEHGQGPIFLRNKVYQKVSKCTNKHTKCAPAKNVPGPNLLLIQLVVYQTLVHYPSIV